MLADIDPPTAAPGEVLVHVHAASVFIGDWHVITGLPYAIRPTLGMRRPKARVAGQEMAGRVEAVGDGVTRFRPGDRVFGTCSGAFAEYVAVPEGLLAPAPSNLTDEQAATVAITGTSALQAVRDKGGVQSGQKVLIIGAAGGVGSFAVQIAKALGAHVTGVCKHGAARRRPIDRRGRRDRLHAGRLHEVGPTLGRHHRDRRRPSGLRATARARTSRDSRHRGG